MSGYRAECDTVLRWGYDLHGTLLDTYRAIEANVQAKQIELKRRLFPEELQALRDRVFTDETFVLEEVQPIPGSLESVSELLMRKQKIRFVSRSDETAHRASYQWLTRYDLGCYPHTYTGRGELKYTVIRRGDFHVFVDNNEKEANPLCSLVPYVFLFDPSSGIDRPEPIPSLIPWNDRPIVIPGFACFTACIPEIIFQLSGQEEEIFEIRKRSRSRRSARKASGSSPTASPRPPRKAESSPPPISVRPRRPKLAS